MYKEKWFENEKNTLSKHSNIDADTINGFVSVAPFTNIKIAKIT